MGEHRAPPIEDMPTEQPIWENTMLYHKTFATSQHAELVTSEAMYGAMMATGDWVRSPGDLGILTAPDAEQLANMPKVDFPTVQTPEDRVAFGVLLQQWQQRIDQQEQLIQASAQELGSARADSAA